MVLEPLPFKRLFCWNELFKTVVLRNLKSREMTDVKGCLQLPSLTLQWYSGLWNGSVSADNNLKGKMSHPLFAVLGVQVLHSGSIDSV